MVKKTKKKAEPTQEDEELLKSFFLEDARKEMEVNPDDITEIEKDMGDFYQTVLELKSTSEI
jgi:hypothetical protein